MPDASFAKMMQAFKKKAKMSDDKAKKKKKGNPHGGSKGSY